MESHVDIMRCHFYDRGEERYFWGKINVGCSLAENFKTSKSRVET